MSFRKSNSELIEQLCELRHHIQEYHWNQLFLYSSVFFCVSAQELKFSIFCVCVEQLDFDRLLSLSILYPIKNPELTAGSQYIQHAGSFEIQRAGSLFI